MESTAIIHSCDDMCPQFLVQHAIFSDDVGICYVPFRQVKSFHVVRELILVQIPNDTASLVEVDLERRIVISVERVRSVAFELAPSGIRYVD